MHGLRYFLSISKQNTQDNDTYWLHCNDCSIRVYHDDWYLEYLMSWRNSNCWKVALSPDTKNMFMILSFESRWHEVTYINSIRNWHRTSANKLSFCFISNRVSESFSWSTLSLYHRESCLTICKIHNELLNGDAFSCKPQTWCLVNSVLQFLISSRLN